MIISRWILLEWEMSQIKAVQKIKTHIFCSITFPRKSWRLWDNVEKFGRDRGVTDDSIMRHRQVTICLPHSTDHVAGFFVGRKQIAYVYAGCTAKYLAINGTCYYSWKRQSTILNLMFIGPCIIVIVEEWKTNLMSLAIFISLLMCSTCFGY